MSMRQSKEKQAEYKEQKSKKVTQFGIHFWLKNVSCCKLLQAVRQTLPLKYYLVMVISVHVPALSCSFPEICLKSGCLGSQNCY